MKNLTLHTINLELKHPSYNSTVSNIRKSNEVSLSKYMFTFLTSEK